MYGFLLLDPAWNWRWSIDTTTPFQKYIFAALTTGLIVGFLLSGLKIQPLSRYSKLGILLLVSFLAICFISTQQSIAPEYSERFMSVLWKQLIVVGIGVLVLNNPGSIKALLVIAVLAQGYNAFQINLDYFQTGFSKFAYSKWGSYGVDNNGYSMITVPILAASLSLALLERRIFLRLFFFSIAGLQGHQLMLMESRGCMLAAVPMIGLAIWKMPRNNGNISLVLIGLILVMGFAGPPVADEFSSIFNSRNELDASAESRYYLWKAGFRITMDFPILGVGPDAARTLVPLPIYYDGGLTTTNKALHNLFFDVSTGTGIPGFLIFLPLYLLPLVQSWRTYEGGLDELDVVRLAVITGIPGYLIASMFSSGLLFEPCYILVVAGFCVSNMDMAQRNQKMLRGGDVHFSSI
jgi:O-antigen ligase